MLTRATVGDVAGINGVEWDAVELSSQFMENWCYDKPTVYGLKKMKRGLRTTSYDPTRKKKR
jgi:oligopeptidase A